jgi:aspartate-semialdehyde dehydrogenase
MMSKQYTVAVVGATGAVGREMLATLARHAFPVGRLRLMASARSAGQVMEWCGQRVVVEDLDLASFDGVDFALFSAGGSVSLVHAPRAAAAGAVVIDNTSAFRMDAEVPLVVPEVNAHALARHKNIIANPNCSTIQMVVALKPLHDAAGLKRVVVSTYQSVSGAGQKGMDELEAGVRAWAAGEPEPAPSKFAHPIAFEALPQIDAFAEGGYTKEELKMIRETRKIMELPGLEVSATCVRVPVMRSHSESVTVDLERALTVDQVRALWGAAPGLKIVDDVAQRAYPLARQASGTEPVWVGRLRQDLDRPATLHFWVVADNLLKGAALNAVQIAEELIR